MDFGYYLPCYWPDMSRHMRDMYRDMVEEARLAESLGFVSFTIPEHHFTNALVHPNALLSAVRVAAATRRVPIITATSVLPFHDVRVLAGEVAQADCLTEGRIGVCAGRGAYRYEFERLGIPIEKSGDMFRESLHLLVRLLSEEDVAADGEFYAFPPTTITPRPVQRPHPPIWFAAMTPGGIDYAVSLGMPVMTTPLRDSFDRVKEQAGAFLAAREKYGARVAGLRLSMLVMLFVTADEAEVQRLLAHAMGRHRRFVNVYTTDGEVTGGAIKPLEVDLSMAELRENLIIGPPDQVVEKLKRYQAEGIHNMQLNMSFGASSREIRASLERFAAHVMPHFS